MNFWVIWHYIIHIFYKTNLTFQGGREGPLGKHWEEREEGGGEEEGREEEKGRGGQDEGGQWRGTGARGEGERKHTHQLLGGREDRRTEQE